MIYFTTNINEDFMNEEQHFRINADENTFDDQPSFTSMSSIDIENDYLIQNNEDILQNENEDPQITITISKKLTKEDLKIIPLPIFNCFYCANDEIAFNLFISNYFSKEYLNTVTSKDIENISNAITSPFKSKIGQFAMNYSEMLQKVYELNEINSFFTSDHFMLKSYEMSHQKITNKSLKEINDGINASNKTLSNREESFLKIDKFDYTKKIKYSDISFEEEAFDIWNPIIHDEDMNINENSQQEDEFKDGKIADNYSSSLSQTSTTYAGSNTTANAENNSMNEHNGGGIVIFNSPYDSGKKEMLMSPTTFKCSILSN